MAHRDGGERGGCKQLFQPLDAGQVEVVGGLVQQHHFRLGNQRLDNSQPFAPPAGEGRGLNIQICEAGTPGQLAQAAFALRFVDVRGRQGLFQHLADRTTAGKTRILGHVSGAGPLAHRKFARVRLNLPRKDGQQRGLAGSIRADQSDAIAVFHSE